jgi:hypothetical protein
LKNIENPELIQEFILFLSFTIQIFVWKLVLNYSSDIIVLLQYKSTF